jgi:putative tryptophan/tyrosine transport system substrate-binding protein
MKIPVLIVATLLLPFFSAPAYSSAAKIPRVGLLRVDSRPRKPVEDFRLGLRELGYVEGRNVLLDIRWAESKLDRLSKLASELVQLNSDVIVTHGPQGVRAVHSATSTTPIVIGRIDDVDVHGFVKTLARPGGNITGLSFQTGELTGKCLELLKETLPKLTSVAVLWDATGSRVHRKAMDEAGRALGVKLQVVEVGGGGDFNYAFEAAAKAQAQAMVILGSPFFTFNVAALAKLSAKHRLPAIYTNTNFAEVGGLMAYGPDESDPTWGWKRAAIYVDKILKGAKVGDLPVEQPTKFDLVINLKTAKQIGLTIPANVLARADKVIR